MCFFDYTVIFRENFTKPLFSVIRKEIQLFYLDLLFNLVTISRRGKVIGVMSNRHGFLGNSK